MVYNMENPPESMDDFGGENPVFSETSISNKVIAWMYDRHL